MGIFFLYTMENIELSKRYLYLSSCAKLVRRVSKEILACKPEEIRSAMASIFIRGVWFIFGIPLIHYASSCQGDFNFLLRVEDV